MGFPGRRTGVGAIAFLLHSYIYNASSLLILDIWFNTVGFEDTWVAFCILDLPCGLVQKQLLLPKEKCSLFCGLSFDVYVWTLIRVMLIGSSPGSRQISSLCRSHFSELFSASMTMHPLVSSRQFLTRATNKSPISINHRAAALPPVSPSNHPRNRFPADSLLFLLYLDRYSQFIKPNKLP